MTGTRVVNLVRVSITREEADIVFQPLSGRARYFLDYLPTSVRAAANYSEGHVSRARADGPGRLAGEARPVGRRGRVSARIGGLPRRRVVEFQSIDELNSFYPMEIIATADETQGLLAKHPDAAYLLFPEDRMFPIRMTDDLPLRWIEAGARPAFRGDGGPRRVLRVPGGRARCPSGARRHRRVRSRIQGRRGGAAIPAVRGPLLQHAAARTGWAGRSRRPCPWRRARCRRCGGRPGARSAAPANTKARYRLRPPGLPATRPRSSSRSRALVPACGRQRAGAAVAPPVAGFDAGLRRRGRRTVHPVKVRGRRGGCLGRTVVVGRDGFPDASGASSRRR